MRSIVVLAAGIAAIALAAPAAAAIMVATYSGTISDSYDEDGTFGGAAGGNLDGLSFVVSYTYNTKVGSRITATGSYDQLTGGTYYSVATPIISTTLTINGITKNIVASYVGYVLAGAGHIEEESESYYSDPDLYDSSYVHNTATVASELPYLASSASSQSATGSGTFQLGHVDYVNYLDGVDAYGTFNTTFASVANTVPEPASWMLMIAGFGLVGMASRRRRVARVA